VLLASGKRKVSSVAESLLGDPTPDAPISYGQIYAKEGGTLIYVVDKIVGKPLLANRKALKQKDIRIRNLA